MCFYVLKKFITPLYASASLCAFVGLSLFLLMLKELIFEHSNSQFQYGTLFLLTVLKFVFTCYVGSIHGIILQYTFGNSSADPL